MSFDKVIIQLKDAIDFLTKHRRANPLSGDHQDDVGMAMCIMDHVINQLEQQRDSNISTDQSKQLLADSVRMLHHYADMTASISKLATEQLEMITHNARRVGDTAGRIHSELNNKINFKPKAQYIKHEEVPF